ncbi:MFS transporter [Tropicimonas sp. S265A]|uniref:MFS transporter n=1 Tax=Tropicimonas sp. S265A TaxID=3415134 RepID=UPI003C7D08E5
MTRPILLLLLSVGIVGVTALMLSPIASAVALGLPGATAREVLFGAALYGAATALSALVLAPQADRVGADRSLRAALGLLAVGFACAGLAPDLVVFLGAQMVLGVATGVALPSAYALAAHAAPAGKEAQTMGLVLSGWTLSLVAGVSVAAFGADLLGWRTMFLALAALAALVMLGLLRTRFTAPRGRATSPLSGLRVPGIGRGLAMIGALMLGFYLTYTYIGTHVTQTLGRSTAAAGLVPLIYGLGFGFTTFLDRYIDRLGAARTARPLFAFNVLLYLGMSYAAPSFAALLALAFLWGFTQHLGLNLAVGRLTALDPNQRGAILGLNSCITYIMVFLGAALGGVVFAALGFAPLPVLSAFLLIYLAVEAGWPGAWRTPYSSNISD